MRSGQLMDILKYSVSRDINSGRSVIDFFTHNNMRGGWESWLQVEYARNIIAESNGRNAVTDFDRERSYPAPNNNLKYDIWVQGGTGIYIELKTQRNRNSHDTMTRFTSDIDKIRGLNANFLRQNIVFSGAVFNLRDADRAPLDNLRTIYRGHVAYAAYDRRDNSWDNVTDNLKDVPIGVTMVIFYFHTMT